MKTRKELQIELEKLNFRFVSLVDIPNRREMTHEEQTELENLEIRINDIKRVLNEKRKQEKVKLLNVGKIITLLAGILFFLITIYTIFSTYTFMNAAHDVNKLVMMSITAVITICLTIGAFYAYTRQVKLQWK